MNNGRRVAVIVGADGKILYVQVPYPPPALFTLARFPAKNRVFELKADRSSDRSGDTVCYVERKV